jgi:ABC-type enterochelin transport system permease subunit
MSLYSTTTGIVLGILTFIPLVGLIVLLIVNGKATNVLRQNGITVGLMGAKSSQIPAP